ncbi:hypothetical protein B0H14DRAFT_2581127 [Mycena olivaceomarginata]|nr:hypothetical protein B0H14DRAFT_2581127 [Mycena olivaceomarginata]
MESVKELESEAEGEAKRAKAKGMCGTAGGAGCGAVGKAWGDVICVADEIRETRERTKTGTTGFEDRNRSPLQQRLPPAAASDVVVRSDRHHTPGARLQANLTAGSQFDWRSDPTHRALGGATLAAGSHRTRLHRSVKKIVN